jgi:branched-chain amino acid transport system substrate-binding protein
MPLGHGVMLRAALVTPLSGPLGGFGQAGAAALSLWADWPSDRPSDGHSDRHGSRFPARVELTVVDAHPDPVAALRRAERTAPDLLFGPYGSSTTAAVAGATSRLVWNHGGARVPVVGNLVSILAPADTYFRGAGAVREASRLGLRAAEGRLPVAGGWQPDGGDEAGMLLVAGPFEDEVAAARRLLPGRWRAAGFVGAGVDEVLADLGAGREGLLGPAQWLAEAAPRPDEGPTAGEFAAAYRRRTGADPPYPAAQAFAAGVIAARCLREAGTADDATLMTAACALECTTMYGRFRLDPRSRQQVGHQVLTVQWQDGARRVIWPPEQAQAPLRYPLP